MNPHLIDVITLASAAVLVVRATCSLSHMDHRTPLAVRLAALLTSIGSAGVLLTWTMNDEIHDLSVAALATGVAIAAAFGRRAGQDHFRPPPGDRSAWNA